MVARRRLGLVVLLAALVPGCDVNRPAATDTTTATTISQTSTTGVEPETLAEFLGWEVFEDPGAEDAARRETQMRLEEETRLCMAKAGFDYIPVIPPDSFFSVADLSEEERVRTQGFGITTVYGTGELAVFDTSWGWTDPNSDNLDTMSASESEAWDNAMHGTRAEQDENLYVEVDPETGEENEVLIGWGPGCQGRARSAVYGASGLFAQERLLMELAPDLEEMQERIGADTRIIELEQAWSRCMGEAGYSYATPDEMQEQALVDLWARVQALVGGTTSIDPFAGWTDDEIEAFFDESTSDQIVAFFIEAEERALADIDKEALAALQREEIALAVADFECRRGHDDVYHEVSAEYEALFIDQHRELLETLRRGGGS